MILYAITSFQTLTVCYSLVAFTYIFITSAADDAWLSEIFKNWYNELIYW